MSVYAFITRKKICCKNVPEMYIFGVKSAKKKFFLIKILGSALFSRVGRETGNTKNLFHPALAFEQYIVENFPDDEPLEALNDKLSDFPT